MGLARQQLVSASAVERTEPLHRLHRAALLLPFVSFVPLYLLPWNPIYAVLASLVLGAVTSVVCRPSLGRKTFVSALLFLAFYAAFMLGLRFIAAGQPLERHDKGVKTGDFKLLTRSRRLGAPTQRGAVLLEAALALIAKEADGRRFRLIGVGVDQLAPAASADPPDLFGSP